MGRQDEDAPILADDIIVIREFGVGGKRQFRNFRRTLALRIFAVFARNLTLESFVSRQGAKIRQDAKKHR